MVDLRILKLTQVVYLGYWGYLGFHRKTRLLCISHLRSVSLGSVLNASRIHTGFLITGSSLLIRFLEAGRIFRFSLSSVAAIYAWVVNVRVLFRQVVFISVFYFCRRLVKSRIG